MRLPDDLTDLCGGVVDFFREWSGQDGKKLQILQLAPEADRGYIALSGIIEDGFELSDHAPDSTLPTLSIIEDGKNVTTAILNKAGVAFAIDGKVLSIEGDDKIAPVGNPRLWEFSVAFTGESFP